MKKETYLMLGGTFLPAFLGVGLSIALKKQAKLDTWDLLIFAGLAAAGGYVTSKMISQ